ncbi:MAG: hypothetical protein DHS20C02_10590 [Micavibrio sp.]|nr:MAG: hypothetical protein DHS20C02_10590 [Micavibrio sp.]
MDVTPMVGKDKNIIHSYVGGRFKVGEEVFEKPIIVLPDSVTSWKVPGGGAGKLQLEHFEPIIAMKADLDVVLFGSGKAMVFLSPDLKFSLQTQGLNIDIMDTGAACRTYNVLMAEGRRVAAALLPT